MRYIETQASTDPNTLVFTDRGDETEMAGPISSRFVYKLTDAVPLTNDTDILGSSSDDTLSNDFGVNFRVSSNLPTRISFRTD